MHPKTLEMDEAQDYPKPGWIELTETLKYGDPDSTWRSHGVTRGVRDMYFERTQPESGWYVHRYCLPAGTMVYGVDGPSRIADIEVGTQVWSVLNERGSDFGAARISGKVSNGVKQLWRVRTKDREVLSTGNHPFLVLSRGGTRKTRREVSLAWVNAEELKPGDVVVTARALDEPSDTSGPTSEIAALVGALIGDGCRNQKYRAEAGPTRWDLSAPHGTAKRDRFEQMIRAAGYEPRPNGIDYWSFLAPELRPWASDVMRLTSPERFLPSWVWSAPRKTQEAFLQGFLAADGHRMHQERGQQPWQVDSTSRQLAEELRTLCIYLGRPVGNLIEQVKQTNPYTGRSLHWWRFVTYDQEIRSQVPSTYSVHHLALHPNLAARTVLEVEATDRFEETWDLEVAGPHNFVADGVVVSNTAMHRPDWSPEEREGKALDYGGRHSGDYKRNILGQHGDETSVLFVLSRLMMCVDTKKDSRYNLEEYYSVSITEERLTTTGMPIDSFLDFPSLHTSMYTRFWVGMDVGLTNHPSEILIFAETTKNHEPCLKLVARIHLERISSPNQRRVLEAIWEFYHPQAIAMDRTGLGLPIYQEIQESGPPGMVAAMRPYNFSEKIVIGYEANEDDEYDPENPYGKEIKANVLEYSSDMLRSYVDREGVLLPWDLDLVKEFQGQTYVVNKSVQNPYGKKVFNQGKFHALDGARMAILGHLQERIEQNKEVLGNQDPVFDTFLSLTG